MVKYDQGGGCACIVNMQSDGTQARKANETDTNNIATSLVQSRDSVGHRHDVWALGVAERIAVQSRDPSTKVGAVIFRPDGSICSTGYNKFPDRMLDAPEWWNDRSEKYDRVVHAEINAVLNAVEKVNGYNMYLTHPPCKECAKFIAASGIKNVTWYTDEGIRERFQTDRSKVILVDSGIEFKEVEYVGNKNDETEGDKSTEAPSCETS